MDVSVKALDRMVRESVATKPLWEMTIEEHKAYQAASQARITAIAAAINPTRPEAKLPECAGFQGSGKRCTACKIHKNLHA